MSTPSHPSSIDPRSRKEDRDLESLEGDVPWTDSYEKSARSPTSLEKKAGKDWRKKGKSRKSQRSRGEDEEDNVSLSPPSRSGRNRNAEVSSHGSASVGSGAARRCKAESSPEGIGAFAVAGLNEPRDTTDIDTILDDASPPPTPDSQQAVIAQAITSEDLANEMREELRSEIRQEMRAFQSQAVAAEVIDVRVATGSVGEDPPDATQSFDQSDQPDEKPFWKKKWFMVATIVLLIAAIAGSVGAVVGGNNSGDKTDSNVAESTDVPISDEPSPPPTLIPPVSGSPTPTMMMPDTSPPTTPPVTSPTLSPTLPPTAPETNPPTPPPTDGVALLQTLLGLESGSRFGVDVEISGDGNMLVGGAIDRNTVIAYRRSGSQWNIVGQVLRGSGSFGGRVDLNEDGTVLVVGARSNGDGGDNAGQVQAYRINSDDEWVQQGQPIFGRAAGDEFGWDVILSDSGLTMAASSLLGDPSSSKLNAGYVRVFTWSGEWIQLGSDIEGTLALDMLGRSIAFDSAGRRIAVGIVNGGGGNGSVRVFDYVNGLWTPVGQALDGDSFEDFQGTSVAFSANGSILAIGAAGNDINGSLSGMVRVYELSESGWIQLGQSIFGQSASGLLGSGHLSLSDDGNVLAAGAQGLDGERGEAYLFQYDDGNSEWVQIAEFRGDNGGGRFGHSVGLSGDGSFFAVGAPNDGAGYVRVFLVTSRSQEPRRN